MLAMRIHESGRSTPGYCIPGISLGEIIETVSFPRLIDVNWTHSVAAALVMYQRARKISNLLGDPSNFSPLAELQLEAYVVAMNALSLLDQKTAWIAIPATAETGHEV